MKTTAGYLKDLVEQKNALATAISENGVEASTDEKLNTLVPKVGDVYKAGQISVIASSEILKGSASGETIAVHDVSPVNHELGVKLTSDTITDFSTVGVSRYGANLFDINNPLTVWYNQTSKNYPCKIEDGAVYSGGVYGQSDGQYLYVSTNGANAISISFNAEFDENQNEKSGFNVLGFDDIDDNGLAINYTRLISKFGNLNNGYITCTVFTTKPYVGVSWVGSPVRHSIKITDIQIEISDTATPYEPYIEPHIVTANSDGTVEGLTSLHPNMTLVTDTEGAVIDLEYYKDIDLAFKELTTNIALSGGE